MKKYEYPHKKWCKKAEKMGIYVREEDEPTQLGWFLLGLDWFFRKFREMIEAI